MYISTQALHFYCAYWKFYNVYFRSLFAETIPYIESKLSAKRQRYQEDLDENRAAKRQKCEDKSAAIKVSERSRYTQIYTCMISDPRLKASCRVDAVPQGLLENYQ